MCNDCGMANNNDIYSTAEAAKYLNTSRSNLTRWVKSGKIKPLIKGEGRNGAMFFRKSEVERVQRSMVAAILGQKAS